MSGRAARLVPSDTRLVRVVLDGELLTGLSALQEADRAQAVADLALENHFVPHGTAASGPFALHLSIRDGRLIFDIRTADGSPLCVVALALGPFRSLLRDYQLLVESYDTAVHQGGEARVQAIDMGRRGLHNEGAELMIARLRGKAEIDFETGRRLFTLVCLLHRRVRPPM